MLRYLALFLLFMPGLLTGQNDYPQNNHDLATKYVSRGLVDLSKHQNQSALQAFDHALYYHPNNVLALQMRGIAFYRLQQYTEAYEDFNAAVSLDQDFYYLYFCRGKALEAMDYLEEAGLDYQEAMDLAPAFDDAARHLYALGTHSRGGTYQGNPPGSIERPYDAFVRAKQDRFSRPASYKSRRDPLMDYQNISSHNQLARYQEAYQASPRAQYASYQQESGYDNRAGSRTRGLVSQLSTMSRSTYNRSGTESGEFRSGNYATTNSRKDPFRYGSYSRPSNNDPGTYQAPVSSSLNLLADNDGVNLREIERRRELASPSSNRADFYVDPDPMDISPADLNRPDRADDIANLLNPSLKPNSPQRAYDVGSIPMDFGTERSIPDGNTSRLPKGSDAAPRNIQDNEPPVSTSIEIGARDIFHVTITRVELHPDATLVYFEARNSGRDIKIVDIPYPSSNVAGIYNKGYATRYKLLGMHQGDESEAHNQRLYKKPGTYQLPPNKIIRFALKYEPIPYYYGKYQKGSQEEKAANEMGFFHIRSANSINALNFHNIKLN